MKIIQCNVCALTLDESDTIDGRCKNHLRGGEMKEYECDKCGHGDYLVLVRSVGDVVCEGCGEWQCAEFNDVWQRVK